MTDACPEAGDHDMLHSTRAQDCAHLNDALIVLTSDVLMHPTCRRTLL